MAQLCQQKHWKTAVYASEELEATSKLAYLTLALEPNALTTEQVNELVTRYNVEWD